MSAINEKIVNVNDVLYYCDETSLFKINIKLMDLKPFKDIKTITPDKPILEFKMPKPPVELLYDFFRKAADVYSIYKSEMEGLIVWNSESQTYYIKYPKQKATAATCNFEWTGAFTEHECLIVDCHSHHTMTIAFSGTDNNCDGPLGLLLPHVSLVVKGIDKFNWINPDENVSIRISYMGKTINIKIADVFDVPIVTKESLTFIEPTIYTAYSGYGGYNYGYGGEYVYPYAYPAPKGNVKTFRTGIHTGVASHDFDDLDDDFRYDAWQKERRIEERPSITVTAKSLIAPVPVDKIKPVEIISGKKSEENEDIDDDDIYVLGDILGNDDGQTMDIIELLDFYEKHLDKLPLIQQKRLKDFINMMTFKDTVISDANPVDNTDTDI